MYYFIRKRKNLHCVAGVVYVCFLVDDRFLASSDDKIPSLVVGTFEGATVAAFGADHKWNSAHVYRGEYGAGTVAAVDVDVGIHGHAVCEISESTCMWVDFVRGTV